MHSPHHSFGSHHGNKKLEMQHDVFPREHQKRNTEGNALQDELRKLRPPTFDGENNGEVAELWLQEMKKYISLHDYSDNQEVKITIFNLHVKSYHWWEKLK